MAWVSVGHPSSAWSPERHEWPLQSVVRDLVGSSSADFWDPCSSRKRISQVPGPGAERLTSRLCSSGFATCRVLIFIFVCQVFKIKYTELLSFHHAFPLRSLINKPDVPSNALWKEARYIWVSKQNNKTSVFKYLPTASLVLFLSSLSSLSWCCYEVRLLAHW